MKTTLSFSLEQSVMIEFLTKVKNNNADKNRVLEGLLVDYNNKNEFYDVECVKCKASYSSKLDKCPQCEAESQKNKTKRGEIESIEQEIERERKLLKFAIEEDNPQLIEAHKNLLDKFEARHKELINDV